MWSHGTFYWNELMTHDAEKAKKFYGSSIGWTFDAMLTTAELQRLSKLNLRPTKRPA
jgi:predicted enzyme related to lactoylglutathione lyase